MTSTPQPPNPPMDEALAERVSAYLDGELGAQEQAEIEQRLAIDPIAKRFAEELRAVGTLCREAEQSPVWRDLSGDVLAEAERRRREGSDQPVVASVRPLEPEGEFGLPFGRSSRGWMWGGVAVAAALMLGFFDHRPTEPAPRTIAHAPATINAAQPGLTPVSLGLERMRHAVPGLRVIRLELTPKGKKLFEQALARRGFRTDQGTTDPLPAELATARKVGVLVEPVARADSKNQLMFVSAEQPHVASLLADLKKDPRNFRVQADPSSLQPRKATPTAPTSRTVTIHLRILRSARNATPNSTAPPEPRTTGPTGMPGGRVPVVFVLSTRTP